MSLYNEVNFTKQETALAKTMRSSHLKQTLIQKPNP